MAGLLPGVYMAATGAPTTLQQEMAALLYAGPGSVITGPAALRSHHIRCELTEIVDVLVPAGRQRRDTNFVRLHRTSRMPARIWEAGPVRYAMPARAVADAVRGMTSLRDVRAAVADAVQRGKCAIKTLAAELNQGPAKIGKRDGYRHRFTFTNPTATLTAEVAAVPSGPTTPNPDGSLEYSIVLAWVSDKPEAPKPDVIDQIVDSTLVYGGQPPHE